MIQKLIPPPPQRGVTLIETAIVIAVGLLLLFGGLRFVTPTFQRAKVQAEAQNLTRLVLAATAFYRLDPALFANAGNANALARGLVPDGLRNGPTPIHGQWGDIVLAPGALTGGAANTALAVSLNRIPVDVCRQLVPTLLGSVDELGVGGFTDVKSIANPNPLPDAAATRCGVAAGGQPRVTIGLRKQ
jgi:type II secretory pathway pseudopilin PulG